MYSTLKQMEGGGLGVDEMDEDEVDEMDGVRWVGVG